MGMSKEAKKLKRCKYCNIGLRIHNKSGMCQYHANLYLKRMIRKDKKEEQNEKQV